MFIIVPVPRIRRRKIAQQPARPMVGPFALTPTPPDGETALFQDSRVGFSHALPGWPRALAASSPQDPCDAAMQFYDFPVWLRYRIDRPAFAAQSAMDLAVRHAHVLAGHTTGAQQEVVPAPPARLGAWSVEAAATARYDRRADSFGAEHEELTVLVRQGRILVVTKRWRRETDWARLALFKSAVDATIVWDAARFRYTPRIWPESTFLEPMAYPNLKGPRQEALASLAPQFAPLSKERREALGDVIGGIVTSDDPPWKPLGPEERAARTKQLSDAAASAQLAALFDGGMREVQTAHDLRGLALMTGWAMAQAAPPAS
jgi:hypothetical protein